jgi:hypothetical protein
MSDRPENQEPENERSGLRASRRGFVKTMAAAGLLDAAATALAPANSAEAGQVPAENPATPQGLGRMGMLDSRFPITYETCVPTAVGVLTDYFTALSQRSLKGIADTLHFPFGTYEGTDAVIVETADDLIAHAPPSMNMTESPERYTDHDGYLKPGSYDVFDGIEVFNADPARVNLSLHYNRYGRDGKKLLRCEGIYCITNNDGRWAIQLASTIFTPSGMIGVIYPDTIAACARLRQDHCLAFQVNDGNVFTRTRQAGNQASISDGNFALMQNNAIAGRPMDVYHTKGVKSRLVVTEVTDESLQRPNTNPDFSRATREMYAQIGHGIQWGFASGNPPPSRVVHATVDKAHMYSGITRFTPSGEEINTTMELDVVTYKKGHWGIVGSPLTFAYVVTHDRVNDL